jgi:acetyl esterase/lipase
MPKTHSSLCFAFLLLFSCRAHAQSSSSSTPTPAPPEVEIAEEHDVVFGKGGTQDLHAEVVHPKDMRGTVPAIIYIHGGGWSGGTHKGLWAVERLARRGFYTASIEYRLSGVAKWPAQIQDCKLAVRWMRANAARFHVDPNHIGAFGDSAGGHLVACLGTMANVKEYEGDGGYPGVSSAVQAVADFFGPTDFTRPDIYTPEAIQLTQGLMGMPYNQDPKAWRSASPLYYVAAGDPPMLMMHGDADTLVPLAQSQVMDEALTKAGVPHQLIIVKNAMHSFTAKPGTTPNLTWEEIQNDVRDFFVKTLGDPLAASPK